MWSRSVRLHSLVTLTVVTIATAGCALRSSGAQSPAGASSTANYFPTPQLFAPDVISDSNEQWRITFTADGKTAYFAESTGFFPMTRQATIYVSEYVNGAWTAPAEARR